MTGKSVGGRGKAWGLGEPGRPPVGEGPERRVGRASNAPMGMLDSVTQAKTVVLAPQASH